MRLSYSAISTYQKCPLSYKFMYVDKLRIKRTPALSFGTSVHAALERFYDVSAPEPPTESELMDHLTGSWERDGYESTEQEQEYLEKGKTVLAAFYQANVSDFRVPAAIEQSFTVTVGNHTVRGIIDRLDRLTSGGYEVIDYKTGAKPPPQSVIDRDLQLSIYDLAANELWDVEPAKLSLYYVVPGTKLSTTRDPGDRDRTRDLINEVASEIGRDLRSGRFKPKKNRLCAWCDFRDPCPLFR
ncbi:MAG: RecB family exonuclease [Terriglobia bacterium]